MIPRDYGIGRKFGLGMTVIKDFTFWFFLGPSAKISKRTERKVISLKLYIAPINLSSVVDICLT